MQPNYLRIINVLHHFPQQHKNSMRNQYEGCAPLYHFPETSTDADLRTVYCQYTVMYTEQYFERGAKNGFTTCS